MRQMQGASQRPQTCGEWGGSARGTSDIQRRLPSVYEEIVKTNLVPVQAAGDVDRFAFKSLPIWPYQEREADAIHSALLLSGTFRMP
jgi:hypothetical protein